MNRLAGRIALVTGAASGIGQGSRRLRCEGADSSWPTGCRGSRRGRVSPRPRPRPRGPVRPRPTSATRPASAAWRTPRIARFGRVDILVNNAGIFTQSLLEDMPVADWDRVLDTNLRGASSASAPLIGPMLERGDGRIINIASQLGQIGGVSVAHYCASKAGVIGLTKALAREVSSRGVLVNAIAPGPIETPLLENETEAWRSAKLAELPIGRFGRVDEVTPTAVLLASADGSYYVGQTLGPNGGDVML